MVWKANKPSVKIRKAAVIIALYLSTLLSDGEIAELFSALSAPLKTCLTDDWAPDLRYASSKLATSLIQRCSILNYEIIRDFYPSLLERLDDS
jgi:dynein assembly factor 5